MCKGDVWTAIVYLQPVRQPLSGQMSATAVGELLTFGPCWTQ